MPKPKTQQNKGGRVAELLEEIQSLAENTDGATGRPPKYTADRVITILDLLEEGNTLATTAALAGIHRDTLNEWRKDFPDFSAAVNRAMAYAERFYVQQIRGAARTDWQAAKFYLTHRSGDDWKPPKQETKVSGDPDAPLIVERVQYKGPE